MNLSHALIAMKAVKQRNIRHKGVGQKMVRAQQMRATAVVKRAR